MADASRAERFVGLWNEGRVEEALGETTDAYSYSDPVMGGPHDRASHVAMMKQIFEAMPDRRITVRKAWAADVTEFIEYTWRGTRPDGEVVEHEFFGVLGFDESGRAARQRHFSL
ncbi:MAG: nuclear transport factor 2 family protein [Acidimicrobiales bacterium]|nr:nuclear transport factor 2 family protein [Acidimicrobiales bacterium]